METRFTKGKWREVARKTYCCIRNNDRVIADIRTVNASYNIFDAHLIAAAPEMYEMIRRIVDDAKDYESRGGRLPTWALDADALLAKARGEQ